MDERQRHIACYAWVGGGSGDYKVVLGRCIGGHNSLMTYSDARLSSDSNACSSTKLMLLSDKSLHEVRRECVRVCERGKKIASIIKVGPVALLTRSLLR